MNTPNTSLLNTFYLYISALMPLDTHKYPRMPTNLPTAESLSPKRGIMES